MAVLFPALGSYGQKPFAGLEHLFTQPKRYEVSFTATAPKIDGDISDAAWKEAAWTEAFTDIEGAKRPAPLYDTRVKMLWNDSCLFLAARMEEPHVWAALQKRDAIIYHDNDFEVFLDPDNDTHQYFEIEVNAFNTILDLFMSMPYRNGASALISYDVAGLQSAVQVQGTVNRAGDWDSGWTVEMAIPFRALHIGNRWKAPEAGAHWRINFSRVQWQTEIIDGKYVKKKGPDGRNLPEDNWVWSPQGVINMHYPERWGHLIFRKGEQETNGMAAFSYEEARRNYLWLIYYRQKEYYRKRKKYAASLVALGLPEKAEVAGRSNQLALEATSRQFTASITDEGSSISLNEEGRVQTLNQ